MNARSIAYFTSAEVTSRSTGSENITPLRSLTVTVRPSFEIFGMSEARSGTGLLASCGR